MGWSLVHDELICHVDEVLVAAIKASVDNPIRSVKLVPAQVVG